MKFKLFGAALILSFQLLSEGFDFTMQHNNLIFCNNCCWTVHLPHWWSLRCLRGGVLLTSLGTAAQGGGVSRLDGGFPPAWWHQALSCPAAAADSGHNPDEHMDRWELAERRDKTLNRVWLFKLIKHILCRAEEEGFNAVEEIFQSLNAGGRVEGHTREALISLSVKHKPRDNLTH